MKTLVKKKISFGDNMSFDNNSNLSSEDEKVFNFSFRKGISSSKKGNIYIN
jgi:hypothetical protein